MLQPYLSHLETKRPLVCSKGQCRRWQPGCPHSQPKQGNVVSTHVAADGLATVRTSHLRAI